MATGDVELQAGDSIGCTVLQFLLDTTKEKGRDLGNQGLPSIFMVPSVLRDLSPASFNPWIVSIGPIHKQDKNVQAFEVQKTAYLHRFLDGLGSRPEQMLKKCVLKVTSKIELIKACYAPSTICNDVELANMMVIDGCFILYLIHNAIECNQVPVNMLIAPPLMFDLVLIENQIPFFVLEDIFESTILQYRPETSLIDYMQELMMAYEICANSVRGNVILDTPHDHILGFLHKSLQPAHHIPSEYNTYPKWHSAVELDRTGVTFRPYQDENWALAMKVEFLPRFPCFPWFWLKPTLKMPILYVDDRTERLLRNLIIYEQSRLVPNYITAYAWAMGMLIDTPEDVGKLVKSGVVETIGSNEYALNIIRNICKNVLHTDFPYFEEWQELDTYYNRYWPNAIAGLKRIYFSSPWNIVALFAGIVLFILTVVQTIFTIIASNPTIVIKHQI